MSGEKSFNVRVGQAVFDMIGQPHIPFVPKSFYENLTKICRRDSYIVHVGHISPYWIKNWRLTDASLQSLYVKMILSYQKPLRSRRTFCRHHALPRTTIKRSMTRSTHQQVRTLASWTTVLTMAYHTSQLMILSGYRIIMARSPWRLRNTQEI